MPQVLSSTLPAATSDAVDSFDHFASGQCLAPELADLVSRIQSWRDHKTFKAQAMPDELKFSIAKLLTSGLHSRAALAKQLGISQKAHHLPYRQSLVFYTKCLVSFC